MTRQYVDISHFRAPYKNWPYLGMGGFGQDAAPIIPDSSVSAPILTTPIPANVGLVTTSFNGVKTLLPAVGIAFLNALQIASTAPAPGTYIGATLLTTAPDKEQVMLQSVGPGSGTTPAINWVNAQFALGRSVIVSTNDPTGLSSLVGPGGFMMGTPGSQIVLAAVSTSADELAAAGPSMPNAALIAPSTLASRTPLQRLEAGMGLGPAGVAVAAVAVVGGGILLISHLHKKKARANRRR